MTTIRLPYNYTPRNYQLPLLRAMDGGIKRAVIVWHRRSGKEKTCLNYMIKRMVERKGTYYYLFPTFTQAKKVLWDGMDKTGFKFMDHFPKELVARTNSTELQVELVNGSMFQLIGTDNIDRVVGTNPVGCLFSEYSLQDPRAWDYLRPILLENEGFAIFNFTPRGKNHAHDLLMAAKNDPAWFSEVLTVHDTKAIPPDILEQERKEIIQKNGDDAIYLQEYECSFTGGSQGAYYAKYMSDMENENRICRSVYDPKLPVNTYWDLGMDDSMAIVFVQTFGKEIRFCDYLEGSGEGIEYYIKKLKEKPYVYNQHYFPHDGEVRELGTGRSRKDVAESLGLRPLFIVPAPAHKADGIQAVRTILPRVWIDEEKCARLIEALKNYTKEFDEMNKIYKDRPVHDWTSHACDAVQTCALGHKDVQIVVGLYDREEDWDPHEAI